MSKWTANKERYTNMQYRRCGRSGLKLPSISLGLWNNFGTNDSFDNMCDILTTAFDLGVTHFDLANNYGPEPGSAETNFGKVINSNFKCHRDEMIVSTKAGYHMWEGPYGEWGSRKQMLSSLDQSLKRMNLDYVDIFYSHRPDPETPLEETMGALHTAVQSGKALYIGLSNYDVTMASKATAILRDLGTPCLIYQGAYNMFNRQMESGHFEFFHREGIGSILFSPLAQGMLTDRYLNGIPEGSRATQEHFLKSKQINDNLPKIKQLNQLAQDSKRSLSQLALAWNLRHDTATSALIGASSSTQMIENLKTLDHLNISSTEIQTIDNILQD